MANAANNLSRKMINSEVEIAKNFTINMAFCTTVPYMCVNYCRLVSLRVVKGVDLRVVNGGQSKQLKVVKVCQSKGGKR